MIDEEYPMQVTTGARALAKNKHSDVGLLLRQHITLQQTVHLRFHPLNSDTEINVYGMPEQRIIDLAEEVYDG